MVLAFESDAMDIYLSRHQRSTAVNKLKAQIYLRKEEDFSKFCIQST